MSLLIVAIALCLLCIILLATRVVFILVCAYSAKQMSWQMTGCFSGDESEWNTVENNTLKHIQKERESEREHESFDTGIKV